MHWYSCEDPDLLQAYIELGCHFTLSTDQGRDSGTHLLWQLAPLDHVHLETDGYEAVVWAQKQFASEPSVLSQFTSEEALPQFSSEQALPQFASEESLSQFSSSPVQALSEAPTRNSNGISAAQTGELTDQYGSSIPATLFHALQNSVKTYAALHKLSPKQAEDLFYRNSLGLLADK